MRATRATRLWCRGPVPAVLPGEDPPCWPNLTHTAVHLSPWTAFLGSPRGWAPQGN